MTPALDDWTFDDRLVLHGKVYRHPYFADGTEVSTSRVVWMDRFRAHTVAGTIYRLKSPSRTYLANLRRGGRGSLPQLASLPRL